MKKTPILIVLILFMIFLVGCTPKSEEPAHMDEKQLRIFLEELHNNRDSLNQRIHNTPSLQFASVRPGQGLYQVLENLGLDNRASAEIVRALSDSVEFVKLRVGDQFQVAFDPRVKNRVVAVRYAPHPALAHILTRNKKGEFVYSKVEKTTTMRYKAYKGVLEKGSNLDGILRRNGVHASFVQIASGVLMCKVSFERAQPGDQYYLLIQERVFQDSILIDGNVLYARFAGKYVGDHEAFRYDDGDPKSSFNAHYTPDGEALVYSGLRYPLDRLHITSPYGMRLHPVLGRREMHWGVDYAARQGTPVYAVADGSVIVSGFDPASGNKIAIKHKDGSSSWYLHLATRHVSPGSKVRSRQVIARSGNTGRSTGPHLHFGFKDARGSWINPLGKRMIATPKLEGLRLSKLKKQIKEIRKLLHEVQP